LSEPTPAPAIPSSLDALETTSNSPQSEEREDLSPLQADNPAQRRLHARDLWRRAKIVECLHHAGGPAERRVATKVASCCRFPIVVATTGGKAAVRLMRCKHRLCPTCGRLRAHRVAEVITKAIQRMNAPRFITLTQIADESSWEARYASLASAFRTLRTHRAWRSRVTGGIYATETTFNQSTSRWHVHMHCVVDGDFFPQKLLSEEWAKASGGSKIVDIRAIHDREKAAAYIAKYVGKPSQPENWPAAKICEYALQSKGKRTWHTFGKLHNLKISDDLPDDGQKTEQVLCGTQRLMAEARKVCGDSLRA
jgi:hypothetical protein